MDIALESFELQNVVHFEKAKVKMIPGLTVVLGHNRDSRISHQQNNGSGKSSLFSAIPSATGFKAPLATSRVTSKKSSLADKNSLIQLNFANFQIKQTPSHWKIFENGEDLMVRGQKLQLEKIRSLFPLSENDFYSYVYVQSQRDCFFQVAKPDARLGFITQMFGLDNYDTLRKWMAKKLGEIKESEIRFSEIESNYLNLMQREQEIAWSEANDEEYAQLTKKVTKARKKLQSIMQEIGENSTLLDGAERSAKARKRYKQLSETIEDPESSEIYARRELELNKKYKRYRREKKAYDEAHARVTAKLEEIGETRSLKKLRQRHEQLTKEIEELRVKERESDELVRKRQAINTKLKKNREIRATYPEKLIPLKKLKNEMAVCKTALSLKKLLHCDDGECPTCHQVIDVKSLSKNIKTAEQRTAVLVEHELGHNVQGVIDRLLEEKKAIPKVEVEELFYSSQIKDKTEELKAVTEEGKRASSRKIYEEELAALKVPKKQPKPEISEAEADALLHDAREMLKLKDLIGKQTDNPKKLRARLDALEIEKRKMEKRFSQTSERWTALKMMRTELDVLVREREAAYKQLEELQPIIERKNLIKSLEKAYGKKGLKLLAANSILGLLEKGLNEHANLIFAEPFRFQVFADDKGVHCRVKRPDGKTSDVTELSGAESDCFRLLFMLATRDLMPASKRTNFVVLDEPDSHMDDATRELFLNTFLPYLQTIVPCVNVITPFSTRYDNADRVIKVVKHHGVATLEIKKAA